MMEVDGQSGHHAAESTTAEIRQRNACAGQHLPAGIIEKGRIVPDVHVSVVVAMRRHHDRAIHFEAVLHDSSLSGLWLAIIRRLCVVTILIMTAIPTGLWRPRF